MFKATSNHFSAKFLFATLLALLAIFNSLELNRRIRVFNGLRQKVPYFFLGNKFLGLNDFFKGIQTIGYYTDKSLNDNQAAAQFAQAQYILTPLVLDLNNLGHEYTLFDCSTPEIALKKIKDSNLIPLKRNSYGIILAKRIF